MSRAAVYARFSTDRQRPESIDAQVRLCREYAKRHGLEVVAVYADPGISGTTTRKRPEYQQMLAAAKAGKFKTLLVEDFSRLTRDEEEGARIAKRFAFDGIRILGVGDHFDSESGGADIHRVFKAAESASHVKNAARQTHRSHHEFFTRGFWVGGRVFGYGLQPVVSKDARDQYGQPKQIGTHLVIDKEQAVVVTRIFATFASGRGLKAVAAMLNKEKVPSPGSYWRGRKVRRSSGWLGSSVRVILRNPIYTGRMQWNRTEFRTDPTSETRVNRARPKTEVLERQDESLRIIDAGMWAATQARIAARADSFTNKKTAASGARAKYLLSGLLICDHCKSHFVLVDKYSYGCGGSVGGGESLCRNTARVNRKALQQAVIDLFRNKLLTPASLKEYAAEVRRYYAEITAAAAASDTTQPKKLKELDARISRLQARIETGDPDLSADDLKAALARLHEERRKGMGVPAAVTLDERLLAQMVDLKSLRRELRHLFNGNLERADEARLVLGRMLPEGLKLRRNARGRLQVRYGLKLIDLPARDGSGGRI